MRKRKNYFKKLTAIVLSAMMTAGMLPATMVFADEGAASEAVVEEAEEKSGEEQTPVNAQETAAEISNASVSSSDAANASVETDSFTAITENLTETTDATDDMNDSSVSDDTEDDVSTEAASSEADDMSSETASAEDAETSETDANSNVNTMSDADINLPVVEEVQLVQQGQSLTEGDIIEVRVKAYDADSGIQKIDILLEAKGEDGDTDANMDYLHIEATYDEAKECYVGSYELGPVGPGSIYIYSIKAVDNFGNYVDVPVQDENGNYIYAASLVNNNNSATLSDLQINYDSGSFDINYTLNEYINYELSAVQFIGQNTGVEMYFYVLNTQNGLVMNGHTLSVSDTYLLDGIVLFRTGGDIQVQIDNPESYSFEYQRESSGSQPEKTDSEAPVIKSVVIDKNGQIVREGDIVNITIKATDNEQLSAYGSIRLHGVAEGNDNLEKTIELAYSEETDVYEGSFTIDSGMYPCEWYIDTIRICDESDNYADYNNVLFNLPYYVQVYSGNTFVNPVYTVSIYTQELNESGYRTYEHYQDIQVERRSTLKEAGFTLPSAVSKYEVLELTGWSIFGVTDAGSFASLDGEILSDCGVNLYASYDKVEVNVKYYYFDENSLYSKYQQEKIYLPYGVTLSEANNSIILFLTV